MRLKPPHGHAAPKSRSGLIPEHWRIRADALTGRPASPRHKSDQRLREAEFITTRSGKSELPLSSSDESASFEVPKHRKDGLITGMPRERARMRIPRHQHEHL